MAVRQVIYPAGGHIFRPHLSEQGRWRCEPAMAAVSGVFVGSLPASLLSADERDGWLAYCDTLPIGRRQLVAAKYVTSAVLTALIITLVLLISALTGQPTVAGGTAVPLSILIPLLLAVGLGVPALMFPVMFKFGATKGRAVYIAVVMIASATCGC